MARTRALLAALGAVATAFAACTTFDGLVAVTPDPGGDGGFDAPADTRPPLPDTFVPPAEAAADASDGATGPTYASYLSITDAVRLCTLVMSCPRLSESIGTSMAVWLDGANFSLCVDWLSGPLPPDRVGIPTQSATLKCAAQGGTCRGAAACFAIEYLTPDDPRCADAGIPLDAAPDAPLSDFERCDPDASAAIHCDPGFYPEVIHCNSGYWGAGAKCMVGDDLSTHCALAVDCPQTTCAGSLLDYCASSGLRMENNCGGEGMVCGLDVTSDAGEPACLTGDREKPCSGDVTACAGDAGEIVTVCDGFNLSEYNCGKLGGKCSQLAGTAQCRRPTDICKAEDANINVCQDSKVSLCVGGSPLLFDCASVGLKCIPGTASLSGHCG